MSQYQLVAAAAEIPATKLLGTTPKGFNATGEYEEASYHETLESIQEHYATPFLEKHHQLVMLSAQMGEVETAIAWNPVDSPTAKEYAEIRKMTAETDLMLAEAGVIEATEIRAKLQADENSGFSNLDNAVGDNELAGLRDRLEAIVLDAEPEDWKTISGAHIPVGEGGELQGEAGKKIEAAGESASSVVTEISADRLKNAGIDPDRPIGEWKHKAKTIAASYVSKDKTYPIDSDNRAVLIEKTGIDKTFSGKVSKTAAIAATELPTVLKNAKHTGEPEKDDEGRAFVKAIHKYESNVNIPDLGKKRVTLVIREMKDGSRYYDCFEAW